MQTFRVLRPDDARELAILHARAFETPWSAAAIRAELAKSSVFGLALVAPEAPDHMLSFTLFQYALDEAEMLTLATDPDHFQKGHATSVLTTAFDHLTERGITACLLEVAVDNQPAIALYQSLGFAQEGTRKTYYKREGMGTVDALLMRREMTGLP